MVPSVSISGPRFSAPGSNPRTRASMFIKLCAMGEECPPSPLGTVSTVGAILKGTLLKGAFGMPSTAIVNLSCLVFPEELCQRGEAQ